MFSSTLSIVAVVFMGLLAVGGLVVAVFFPQISTKAKTNKRIGAISSGGSKVRGNQSKADNTNNNQRRKQVQDTLKQLEQRQKDQKKRVPLSTRIEQAGLSMSVKAFWIISLIAGLVVGAIVLVTGSQPWMAGAAAFATGLGLPRWVLSALCARRQTKFLEEFANAIDIVVRGIKSGLPVNDCLKIVANEIPEPVGPEFSEIVDAQKLGVPMDQCLERMYERMPLAEVNFLNIVITIQQKTGGNLAEALNNLSGVLRDRKKMKAKVQAMSQEAKASAAIIGSLPIGVMGILYMTNPEYITLLWTTSTGHGLLTGSGVWMLIGVLVMRKMINFNI